ncbi:MAG: NAD-dependent epimerase/dehydratase family protein [Deltaproteobacteria bacterium]|nr:NAD-dependent epimerase/dehydratase family protein [Deltaproteobacteria bacterium]
MKEYILISGICGNFGKELAAHLHKEHKIIGIDRREFLDRPKDIIHFQIDIRRKKIEEIFRKYYVKVVIHLNIIHNPRVDTKEHYEFNLTGTSNLLELSVKYKVPQFIFLSSADIYGPSPDNPLFIPETHQLSGSKNIPVLRDLVETDLLVQSYFWKAPSMLISILRPCHIVGMSINNGIMQYIRSKIVPTIAGFNPMIQVVHMRDVLYAIELVIKRRERGIFNVSGQDQIPLLTLLKESKISHTPILPLFEKKIFSLLFTTGLTSLHPEQVDFLKYPCMVDDARIREKLSFKPSYKLSDIINEMRIATNINKI